MVVAWFQATFYGRQEKVFGAPAVILCGVERVRTKISGQPNFLIIEDCSATNPLLGNMFLCLIDLFHEDTQRKIINTPNLLLRNEFCLESRAGRSL